MRSLKLQPGFVVEQIDGDWEGHLIFLRQPNLSLLNQLNPVLFRLSFNAAGVRCRLGDLSEQFGAFGHEVRMIDSDTVIGKWIFPEMSPLLLKALRNYGEPETNRLAVYYLARRARAGVAVVGQ
jgi:hypothetical protein